MSDKVLDPKSICYWQDRWPAVQWATTQHLNHRVSRGD